MTNPSDAAGGRLQEAVAEVAIELTDTQAVVRVILAVAAICAVGSSLWGLAVA